MKMQFPLRFSLSFITRIIILFISSTFFSIAFFSSNALANTEQQFKNAVLAVEAKDYKMLRRIIRDFPEVMEFQQREGCSLFCEFAMSFGANDPNGRFPYVDVRAIEILLEQGGNPVYSRRLIPSLLVYANRLPINVEFPIDSKQCSATRDQIIPLLNKLILAGANLKRMDLVPNKLDLTGAYFYSSMLCDQLFVCGASYERPQPEIPRAIIAEISKSEVMVLKSQLKFGRINPQCAEYLFNH